MSLPFQNSDVLKKATSRAEAKRFGLKRYFNGVPCINGHIADRRTRDYTCCACHELLNEARRRKARTAERQRIATIYQACTRCTQEKPLLEFRCTTRTKLPDWCVKCRTNHADHQRKLASGRYAQQMARRNAAEKRQKPRWAKSRFMDAIYAYARFLRDNGIDCHVDHIVPLRGETASGLHAADNLRVLMARTNVAKSNDLPANVLSIPSEWQNPVFQSWAKAQWT